MRSAGKKKNGEINHRLYYLIRLFRKMKVLRYTLLTFALIIGFSITSMAQRGKNDPPPKKTPPEIVPGKDKDKPKDKPKDNDRGKDGRGRKPE
jgi:hypothetical protein